MFQRLLLAEAIGCKLVLKPLLGADINHGRGFPNNNHLGEQSFDH